MHFVRDIPQTLKVEELKTKLSWETSLKNIPTPYPLQFPRGYPQKILDIFYFPPNWNFGWFSVSDTFWFFPLPGKNFPLFIPCLTPEAGVWTLDCSYLRVSSYPACTTAILGYKVNWKSIAHILYKLDKTNKQSWGIKLWGIPYIKNSLDRCAEQRLQHGPRSGPGRD